MDDRSVPITLSAHHISRFSVYGVVLRLAMPTVLAMLSQSVVNEVDIVFLSRLPYPESSNAQAALFPSLILLWMFGGSLSAISVGTQAITARRFAEKKTSEAGGVLVNSWLFSLVAGVLFTVLAYASLPWILEWVVKVPDVRVAAHEYLSWRLVSIASMAMTFSFKAFFDGIGKTHVHMISALVMNALNVALCLFFIFGQWGAPRMGIAGAGLAGTVSSWVGFVIMWAWSTRKSYRGLYEPFAVRKWSRRIATSILRLSVPSAVATIAIMSGFLLFATIVGYLDDLSIEHLSGGQSGTGSVVGTEEAVNGAATTVLVGVLKLTFTACLAFGTATATLVSQSLGEGDGAKAERFGWASVRLGISIFGIVGLVEGVLFPEEILAFVSQSQAVREAALFPLKLMGICTPFIAVAMILTQALFGAGNSRFVMMVELLLHALCLVPLAWVLGITLEFGLAGIWGAAVIYVLALCAAMVWKFSQGDWKTIRI